MKSVFGKLNKKDIKRGLGLAGSAAITYFFSQMMWGIIPSFDTLQQVGCVFAGTLGSYLFKNLFTNSQDEFGRTEHEI